MAYQCNECNGWTADTQKHECIYDQFQDLQKENERLKNALAGIENPEAVMELIEAAKRVAGDMSEPYRAPTPGAVILLCQALEKLHPTKGLGEKK